MTSNGLLIGFRDTSIAAVPPASEDNLIKENVLGGYARYPLHESSINVNLFFCPTCKCYMNLLVQLYCPLAETDRFIHIFACCRSSCSRGTWLITRTVVPFFTLSSSDLPAAGKSEVKFTAQDDDTWFDDAEDWTAAKATSTEETSIVKQATSHQSDSPSHESSVKVTRLSDECNGFQAWYIAVEDEADLKSGIEAGQGTSSAVKSEVSTNDYGEAYEKTSLFGSKDEVCSKFWRSINKLPSQIIRYHLDQEPLLSKTINDLPKQIEPCAKCKNPRRFEMQLMPALISILQPKDSSIKAPEFNTVLIYTCSKDCSLNEISVEQAIVLEDPDISLVEARFKSASS